MPQIVDDSHQVSILAPPVGEIYNVNIPATVKADEEWYGTFDYRNVGGSPGWFRVEVTGDNLTIVRYSAAVMLKPGEWWSCKFWGLGPGDVTMKLRLAQRGQGDHYHVDVGELPSARTASSIKERSYGESLDVIVGSGVGPPEAALVNPRFPSAVGLDESWRGTLELRNLGAREGWFFYDWTDLGEDYSGLWWVPAGVLNLFWINWVGPIKLTIRWNVAEWVDAAIVVATVGPHTVAGAGGELRNLVISNTAEMLKDYVLDEELWVGGVQVRNIGDAPGNFRAVFTGDITGTSSTFTLGPMEHAAVYFEEVGPKVFTITAQREVDAVWVDDDSRGAEACKRALIHARVYYHGVKYDGDCYAYTGDVCAVKGCAWVGGECVPGVSWTLGWLEIGEHVDKFSSLPPSRPHRVDIDLAEHKPYWLQLRQMGYVDLALPGQGFVDGSYVSYSARMLNYFQEYRHPHPPE